MRAASARAWTVPHVVRLVGGGAPLDAWRRRWVPVRRCALMRTATTVGVGGNA